LHNKQEIIFFAIWRGIIYQANVVHLKQTAIFAEWVSSDEVKL